MKYYLYIAINSNQDIYIGQSCNLKKRIIRHNKGIGSKFTKEHRKDFKIVYYEVFNTRKDAMNREYQIKKWSRKKKIALINKDIKKLHQLSKRKT